MAGPVRAVGPVVPRGVHETPFHSHVSPRTWLPTPPPNMTVTPRVASQAIPKLVRPGGPAVARWVQVVPFHSHVSVGNCAAVPSSYLPPNSTVTPRTAS